MPQLRLPCPSCASSPISWRRVTFHANRLSDPCTRVERSLPEVPGRRWLFFRGNPQESPSECSPRFTYLKPTNFDKFVVSCSARNISCFRPSNDC